MSSGRLEVANSFRSTGTSECTEDRSRLEIICDQIIDSAILGGLAGIPAFVASAEPNAGIVAFALAFGLRFLSSLKKMRKIQDV
jgi:hypothetical protein